jgi:hypothetical protein
MDESKSKSDWQKLILDLYPVAKGSVREVKKGCGYDSCKLCRSGEKHQAYLFTYYKDGKQCSHHVPKPKLELLRQALENGRELERLMVESALELIKSDRKKKN